MSTKEPTVTADPGVSVDLSPEPATSATTVSDVSLAQQPLDEDRGGLGVGLMVLLVFTVTILTALADTAFNGSITYITGAVFVIVSVVAAATIGYRDLSTTIITPP
ncbi:MAG TPA: hypothetical protein PK902_09080, partial [Actinomycetota bacterium]|nr:hypothetical protein [Actinomycetota bacterium]